MTGTPFASARTTGPSGATRTFAPSAPTLTTIAVHTGGLRHAVSRPKIQPRTSGGASTGPATGGSGGGGSGTGRSGAEAKDNGGGRGEAGGAPNRPRPGPARA